MVREAPPRKGRACLCLEGREEGTFREKTVEERNSFIETGGVLKNEMFLTEFDLIRSNISLQICQMEDLLVALPRVILKE